MPRARSIARFFASRPAADTARLPAAPWVVFGVGVLGIAVFSCMDALMKHLVLAAGVYTTLLWRSAASTLLSGALYAAARPRLPTAAALRVHAQRGGVSTLMTVAFFWGLARVPMAQAVALTFIAPLLAIFLAALVLHEPLRPRTLAASGIALGGVVVILLGQWHAALGPRALRGSAAILVSALCYAVNIVLMRRQALLAGPLEVAFSQSLIVGLLLAAAAPFMPLNPAAAPHAALIALAAALAVISLLLLAWAYARGEASRLSAGEYTAFLWASLLGWLVFHEPLTTPTLAGAALIVAGCAVAAGRQA